MNHGVGQTAEAPAALLARLRSGAGATDVSFWGKLAEHHQQTHHECLAWLGQVLALDTMEMDALYALEADFSRLPYAEAVKAKALVSTQRNASNEIVCITANPFDFALQSRVEAGLSGLPRWVLVHPDDLIAYFARVEEKLKAMDGALPGLDADSAATAVLDDISMSSLAHDISPVIRLVNSTLFDALKATASDIHWEVGASGLVVKYRIDGVLSQVAQLSGATLSEQVVSRIKVMAELDISERRVPQDGRFKLSIKGREIDFRVSIMPSLFGEDVVVRILDRQTLSDHVMGLRLDHLGFDANILARVRDLAREPYGMLLVTGPTGSGKTTTLYAALSEIHTGQDKIVTIEDPVEYASAGGVAGKRGNPFAGSGRQARA